MYNKMFASLHRFILPCSFLGISVADLSSDDLELTHMLCESLLVSDTQMSPGGEEAALNACSRLRHTVDTLLELLNQANKQVKNVQTFHIFCFKVLFPVRAS